jgi:transcriptional regulator with PAS, ATPase and Fis domain
MRDTVARLKVLAMADEVVLLCGETGTGKELLARAIHLESKRSTGPFIAFNCSSLSRELVESRLFGHHKGAFTGADRQQLGVIRAAHGGTLLLDEIEDLSFEVQGALLRFLQSGEIQPVGASKPANVDVRVIAATNRNLLGEINAGQFRADLYHRLNVTSLHVPPLRARTQDIMVLARHFDSIYSKKYDCPALEFSREEIARLLEYEWPGNVRQLENYVKQRILLGPDEAQGNLAALGRSAHRNNGSDSELEERPRAGSPWSNLSEAEKHQSLKEVLEYSGGNVSRAAKALGINRRTVQRALRRMTSDGYPRSSSL